MKKLALVLLAGASAAILSLSAAPQSADAGGKPCARKEFKTELVKNACKKDQAAAKKVMRDFVKQAKAKSGQDVTCSTCHTKTSGDYPLKADGLKKFKDWGGK